MISMNRMGTEWVENETLDYGQCLIISTSPVHLMLHSHGIRQTVDGKVDVIQVDDSRTLNLIRSAENASNGNGRQHGCQKLK